MSTGFPLASSRAAITVRFVGALATVVENCGNWKLLGPNRSKPEGPYVMVPVRSAYPLAMAV